MWFGEPHSFSERESPTRLSTSGQQSYEGWPCRLISLQVWRSVVLPLAGARDFSLFQNVRPTLGLFSRYRCSFAGVKRPGLEDHCPPSSAEVKNEWRYTSAPSICLSDELSEVYTCIIGNYFSADFTKYLLCYQIETSSRLVVYPSYLKHVNKLVYSLICYSVTNVRLYSLVPFIPPWCYAKQRWQVDHSCTANWVIALCPA